MRDSDDSNDIAEAVTEELIEFCGSDSLSEEGLRAMFQRHGLTPDNSYCVEDYEFFFMACHNELVTEGIIRCLLEYFPDAANAIDDGNYGWTPLHLACGKRNMTLNIVKILIDAAPNSVRVVDNDGWMPLHHLSCDKGGEHKSNLIEIFKLLIKKCPEALQHATNVGNLPIHLTPMEKSPEVFQLLIDAAPITGRSTDIEGWTPLHYLCNIREIDDAAALKILKLLLHKCPEAVRYADDEGYLPILRATRSSRSHEFYRLLTEAYPGSERMSNYTGNLPLHHASCFGGIATVEYLYKLYPDAINHATIHGYYPIHCAILGDHAVDVVKIVKFLLDCDPSVARQKHEGKSLLYFACIEEFNDSNIETAIEIVKIVYDAYPEAIEGIVWIIRHCHLHVQAFINIQLVCARQARDYRLMTTPDDIGRLPLHTALQNSVTLGSVKLLVKGNPRAVQSSDNNGAIPLHIACQHHNSASIIRYLVGLNTSTLDVVDRGGNTALHYACRSARHEVIAMLLEKYDAVSVSKRNAHKKLPVDLLWESDLVSDRKSIEYTESVYRLLRAYPEMITSVGKQVQSTLACPSENEKKRKFGHD